MKSSYITADIDLNNWNMEALSFSWDLSIAGNGISCPLHCVCITKYEATNLFKILI